MLEAREEVEHEILWELNSGNTSVWHENWTGIGPLYHVLPQEFNINEKLQEVEELRNGDTWDELTLDQNFPADISDHIRHNVPFHHTTEELDTPQWMPTTTGKFYVNSAWRIMRQRATHNPELCNLWTKVLPFKIFFFLWRLWKMKIPTDDLWRRNGYIIVSKCWCCSPPKEDSYQYLFLKSETVNRVWKSFLQLAGIIINMVQVHQVVRAWWSWFKCNSHGASKGNPGPSSYGYYIRDSAGDLIYAQSTDIGQTTNIVVEAKGILYGLMYCVDKPLHPLIMESDSLVMKKIIKKEWECPWTIRADVKKIKEIKGNYNVLFQHVFREGNAVADLLANLVFSSAGDSIFNSFHSLPPVTKTLINMDKSQIPNIRVRVAKKFPQH
ncbi:uncharacterized protein LOC142175265 [Nicotiana tabacum]|uniref:Uncharacterized protein LOC142175265 n=1 Tax=Nicotiana tabacum TaxID=4097 RepID=A0AC58TL53_TOBAC